MIPVGLAEVAEVVGGTLADADGTEVVSGAPTLDSRDVPPGGLFVALAGEHVDGHDYAAAAHASGAAAVLGSRATGVPTVLVPDAAQALGRLAAHQRARLTGTHVLALTGSQGKTGTKDYLAAVLTHHDGRLGGGGVVATRGNLNNELGVPLTVLRADPGTRHLVVEMGARDVGHVAELCAIAHPDVAAVLNVGSAHLSEFGSVDAIARAKGEIVEALPAHGTAVLNADDPRVAAMRPRTRAGVRTFGGPGADVAFADVVVDGHGRATFTLAADGGQARVGLALPGRHQVANATAAAAMALAVGVSFADVVGGLVAARPPSRWRMEVAERADGLVVVNDAYNANPASVRAALDTLADLGAQGRRTVAVLGGMRELGGAAQDAHREVGAHAAALGLDVVVVVGEEAAGIAEGAAAGAGLVVTTAGRDEATDWVRQNVRDDPGGPRGTVVLVKASRGVALEHLAQALLDDAGASDDAGDSDDTDGAGPAAGEEQA